MLEKEISRGITHIEDLATPEFIRVVNNLKEYYITEKVDGAQLLFGIDENGFYTSRETKGGMRVYAEEGYDIKFSSTYMRSAHLLLEAVLPQLMEAGMRPGDQVEAEVLYGPLPNVVPYSEDTNYLIFLRTTEGTVNIDRLRVQLAEQALTVRLESPVAHTGRDMILEEEENIWKFSSVPSLPVNFKKVEREVSSKMMQLASYLKSYSGYHTLSNFVVESIPLNRRPAWCQPEDWKYEKEELKEIRTRVQETTYKMKLEIKEILLNHIVRNQSSSFGPLLEDGGWIEGAVLRHKDSGRMVKLVDKNVFGVAREFAWDVRNQLTERAKSTEGNLSFLGSLYVDLATAVGHPELGTIRSKQYASKLNLNEEVDSAINIDNVKEYWINLLETREQKLLLELDKYENEKSKKAISIERYGASSVPIEISYGRTRLDTRTKEAFASIFEQIKTLKLDASIANTVEDLVDILVYR